MWKMRGLLAVCGLVVMTWMSGLAWGQETDEADVFGARIDYRDNATDPTKVIVGSTALPREARTWNWSSLYAGVHQFDYQVNRNVNMGIGTIVPIGVVGAMAHLSVYGQVAPALHLGLKAQVGIGGAYIFPGAGVFFGGGPMMTIGNKNIFLNVHVPMYGLTLLSAPFHSASPSPYAEGDPNYGVQPSSYSQPSPTVFIAIPNIGFSARVSQTVRLNLEVHVPLSPMMGGGGYSPGVNGRFWLIQYGVRISGKHLYGDIFFTIPIAPGSEQLLMYMPIGIPGFSLGYKF